MRKTCFAAAAAVGLFIGCNVSAPEPPGPNPTPGDGAAVGAPPRPGEEIFFSPIDVVVPAPPAVGASDGELRMGTAAATAPVVIYMHRGGRRYTPGWDDAKNGVSSVLSYYKLGPVDFPAATFTDLEWSDLLARVRAYFSRYAVTITDVRPASGVYTEIAVGAASGAVLGLSNNTTGIAPLGSCRVVPGAVGFVFHELYTGPYKSWYGAVAGAAETVAHEIGHTLSLSHEQLDADLMSYAPWSPTKDFQDAASACGTSATAVESCSCGGATQNSRAQLLTMVGARPTPPPPPPTTGDTKAPTVTIASPAEGASVPGNAVVDVAVDASDDVGVASVELYWEYSDRLLACDDAAGWATCTRSGGRTTWHVNAGTGARRFYAVAKDAAGNRAQSATRAITLTGAPPPPPVDAAPVVTPDLPRAGTVLTRGGTITFRVRVTDDKSVGDVRAYWGYPGGSLEYTMQATTTAGVYEASTTVSGTAAAGKRTVWFSATDGAGQRTTTTAVEVIIP